MGRWQTPKAADGGVMRLGENPSVTAFGRATSPFVLRKNREELAQSFANGFFALLSVSRTGTASKPSSRRIPLIR